MKNTNQLAVLALVPVVLLSGCTNDFSKKVQSLDDFLAVASASEIQIQSSVVRLASANSTVGSDSSTGSAASASSASEEDAPAHGAYLYANDNYVYSNGALTITGYSETHGDTTDYFLINGSKKNGFVTNDKTLLTSYLTKTKTLLASDYATLSGIYDKMKTYAGKRASDFAGMRTLELTRTIAGDAAGYALHTVVSADKVVTETSVFLTMDQIDGKWAFTNYSSRITTTKTADSGGSTVSYSVTEAILTILDTLPSLSVALGDLNIYLYGKGQGDVSWVNGMPLSSK